MSEPVFLFAALIACGTVLMIVKTIAAAVTASSGSSTQLNELREQAEHTAALMEEAQALLSNQSAQIAELQERVDFAERLLTQSRDRGALGSGDLGS